MKPDVIATPEMVAVADRALRDGFEQGKVAGMREAADLVERHPGVNFPLRGNPSWRGATHLEMARAIRARADKIERGEA